MSTRRFVYTLSSSHPCPSGRPSTAVMGNYAEDLPRLRALHDPGNGFGVPVKSMP